MHPKTISSTVSHTITPLYIEAVLRIVSCAVVFMLDMFAHTLEGLCLHTEVQRKIENNQIGQVANK